MEDILRDNPAFWKKTLLEAWTYLMGLICSGHYCPIVRNVCGHCEKSMTTSTAAHAAGRGMNISGVIIRSLHSLLCYLSRVWWITFLFLQGGSNESPAVLHAVISLFGQATVTTQIVNMPANTFTFCQHTNWFNTIQFSQTLKHLKCLSYSLKVWECYNCLQPSVYCQNSEGETGLQLPESPSIFQFFQR